MKDGNEVREEESSTQQPHIDHKAKMRVVWHRQKQDAGLHCKVPVCCFPQKARSYKCC